MAESRRRRAKVQALPEHLVRREEWNGLRRGDPVEIEGLSARGAAWKFLGHVRNERNGAESVEVIGGRPGEDRVRSFLPRQVFPLGGRKTGAASLADAPQLPL
jgi:hypothetical protein